MLSHLIHWLNCGVFVPGLAQDPSRNPSFPLVRKAIMIDLLHRWKFGPVSFKLISCNPGWSDGWRKRGSSLYDVSITADMIKKERKTQELKKNEKLVWLMKQINQTRRIEREKNWCKIDQLMEQINWSKKKEKFSWGGSSVLMLWYHVKVEAREKMNKRSWNLYCIKLVQANGYIYKGS